MKRLVTTFLILLVSLSAFAGGGKTYTLSDYEKLEIQIPMRDGVKLFTSVYQPKEAHPDSPIIITRTPYGVGPYGEGFRRDLYEDRSWSNFVKAGYVIVFQDVRGRYLSEGSFTNIPPLYSVLEQQGRLSKKRSDNPGSLQRNISPKERISYSSYISDPLNPVPYMNPEEKYSYKLFMASDQSFASKREDVICFNGIRQSETLKLEGPVRAVLYMSANAEDVDLIVKLIDEGPDMMPGENRKCEFRHGILVTAIR